MGLFRKMGMLGMTTGLLQLIQHKKQALCPSTANAGMSSLSLTVTITDLDIMGIRSERNRSLRQSVQRHQSPGPARAPAVSKSSLNSPSLKKFRHQSASSNHKETNPGYNHLERSGFRMGSKPSGKSKTVRHLLQIKQQDQQVTENQLLPPTSSSQISSSRLLD